MTATAIPEQGTYDTTVYMLQITDPVQGYNPSNSDTPANVGVSNQPILNLANRTGWLYNQINNILDGATVPTGLATLLSPNFTGTPTAPTPALGDNSTKISTTAFVQGSISGLLSLSVAGGTNVTLTAAQAGNGILNFTGVLTANIAVIVPGAGKWIVENSTTGAYSLTVKTAAGTGVAVAQGYIRDIFCDGTNVGLATTDFTSVILQGTPVAPTPAVGDQSTKIATTNFAYQLKNGVVTVPVGGSSNVTLTAAQYGNGILLLTGALTGAIQVILPAQGGYYVVANETTGAYGLTMGCGGAGKTATIPQGQSVIVYCDGTNVVLAGAAASSSFTTNSFTATAGQTTFSCSYTPGNILVIRNGSTVSSANFTATDGANVIMATAATAGEEINVIAFSSFTVANAVTVAGGTMQGALQLFGGDTGATPAQFDNSMKLATTAFVQQALGNMSGFLNVTAATTLSSSNVGMAVNVGGSSTYTIKLPLTTTVSVGSVISIRSNATVAITIATQGSDVIGNGVSTPTTMSILQGDTAQFLATGTGTWIHIGGSAFLAQSAQFGSAIATGGYQKLPSGLIIQWGVTATVNGGTGGSNITTTFPLAFPNAPLQIIASPGDDGTNATIARWAFALSSGLTKTSFILNCYSPSTPIGSTFRWIAIGW